MVERITGAGQSPGPALHRHPLKLTGATFAEFGQMVDVEVYVVGNEQIQLTVVIVIHEGRARGPSGVAHTSSPGDIGKGPFAVILKEMVFPQARHIEIIKTIIVVIADGDSHP